jgi:ribosomal-protein-alanine N-acetyltransferase
VAEQPPGLGAVAFHAMTHDDALAIARWRYPPPYDFYDTAADEGDLAELFDPARREREYSTALDETGEIIGFAQLRPHGDEVEVGLGLRPDLTGRGLGATFLEAVLDAARERYAPARFTLAVAGFNRRAITVYERAGFTTVRRYRHRTNGGEWDFIAMERAADRA